MCTQQYPDLGDGWVSASTSRLTLQHFLNEIMQIEVNETIFGKFSSHLFSSALAVAIFLESIPWTGIWEAGPKLPFT